MNIFYTRVQERASKHVTGAIGINGLDLSGWHLSDLTRLNHQTT